MAEEKQIGKVRMTPQQESALAPSRSTFSSRGVCGALVILVLALLSISASGAASVRDIQSPANSVARDFAADFTIGDFDGDSLPDIATVQPGSAAASHANYWIQFAFGVGNRRSFLVSAPTGGLQIASRDVNGDSFLDVIISTRLANDPVAVLLNDGRGNFHLMDVRQFSLQIWQLRSASCRRSTLCGDPGVAMPGAGWEHGASPPERRCELPRVIGEILRSSPNESAYVPLHEIRGRAPPLA